MDRDDGSIFRGDNHFSSSVSVDRVFGQATVGLLSSWQEISEGHHNVIDWVVGSAWSASGTFFGPKR